MSTEILILLVVVLVLFGSSSIPKFARSIGQAKSEFEKGLKEGREGSHKKEEKESNDTKDA
jgi:sec-independent protein translocase protein TatA